MDLTPTTACVLVFLRWNIFCYGVENRNTCSSCDKNTWTKAQIFADGFVDCDSCYNYASSNLWFCVFQLFSRRICLFLVWNVELVSRSINTTSIKSVRQVICDFVLIFLNVFICMYEILIFLSLILSFMYYLHIFVVFADLLSLLLCFQKDKHWYATFYRC